MPSDREKQVDQRREAGSTGEPAQPTIRDLAPDDDTSAEVRGGLEPPDGIRAPRLVPPNT